MPDLMQLMVSERAEALHVYPGAAPILEVKRALHRLQGARLTPAGVNELLHSLTNADDLSEFEREGMVSFDYRFGGASIFHVIAFSADGHARLEIRSLNDEGQRAGKP
jgi:Tfp pilus assembly ATPase PilU